MRVCARCGKEIPDDTKIRRGGTCPHCSAYLHACVNCVHYSPGMHNDCREPQAEYVGDKRGDNFCDYFVFRKSSGKPGGSSNARDAFNNLFG